MTAIYILLVMPTKKKKLELVPKLDEREVVVRAIANSIQNLPVSGIIQLINEGWIDEQEIDEVLVLLSGAGKLKLTTAIRSLEENKK